MTLEEIAAKEAAAAAAEAEEAAKKAADEANENPEVDADGNPIQPKGPDIDFKKELETIEKNEPPKRTEREKAEHTIKSIFNRFPDLKGENAPKEEDDKFSAMESRLSRQQVEGIIRQNSKTDDEVRYKMFFYDNKIVKSGNIYEDADNAEWLANKARTRNAISEIRRKPESPGAASGAGQRAPVNSAPEFPPDVEARMSKMGLKKIGPGHWEGVKVGIKWNPKTKTMEEYMVSKK